MVMIKMQFDKNKFSKQKPVYYKGGSLPYKPINNHQIYFSSQSVGGFIDFSSIINAGKNIVDVVKDNKDLIQTGISTVGSIANAGKAIADTIKKSKELEEIKTIQEINQKKKKNKGKEIELTKEQE